MIDTKKPLEDQKDELSNILATLNTKVAELEGMKEKLQSGLNDNRKLHYQEAGQWARHYSTVRMTIATFAVTACATIIGLKWDELAAREYIWNGPICLWLLAALIFMAFTYQTFDRLNSQMKYRDLLPAQTGEAQGRRPRMVLDAGAIAVSGLTLLFGWMALTRGSGEIYCVLKWALVVVGTGWNLFALVMQLIKWK